MLINQMAFCSFLQGPRLRVKKLRKLCIKVLQMDVHYFIYANTFGHCRLVYVSIVMWVVLNACHWLALEKRLNSLNTLISSTKHCLCCLNLTPLDQKLPQHWKVGQSRFHLACHLPLHSTTSQCTADTHDPGQSGLKKWSLSLNCKSMKNCGF